LVVSPSLPHRSGAQLALAEVEMVVPVRVMLPPDPVAVVPDVEASVPVRESLALRPMVGNSAALSALTTPSAWI
jgi:hypothetical protein